MYNGSSGVLYGSSIVWVSVGVCVYVCVCVGVWVGRWVCVCVAFAVRLFPSSYIHSERYISLYSSHLTPQTDTNHITLWCGVITHLDDTPYANVSPLYVLI